MDAQTESCEPPPCDPQPPGKIRKALKLFSKRKPSGAVANLFSMRGKSDGGLKSPTSRSKTIDGITDTVVPEADAESVDLDQEDNQKEDPAFEYSSSKESNLESTSIRQSISSITSAKSLSFLTMLRRSRKGGGGERQAQTESLRPGQQRKGLKGLFGNVRWNRKDKDSNDEVEPGPPLLTSRSNSVEIMKESPTLTPRHERHSVDETETDRQLPPLQDDPASSMDTIKVSESAKSPTNDRLSTLLGDISSILSLETLAGGGDIVADVEAEWVKVSSRVEEGDGKAEVGKKDKSLSDGKPTLSPTPTLSSTSSTKPSPTSTTKPISSSTISSKLMPSPTTKPPLSPPSSPSPTISAKHIQSSVSTRSPTTKTIPSSVPTPISSPTSSPRPIPTPVTISKSPPTSLTLTISTKPTFTPISPPTPEPSPNPSPTPSPGPTHAAVISPTVISPSELYVATVDITETTLLSTVTSKHTTALASTPITKPSYSSVQELKHSSGPSSKYPPFNTSTKPTPAAPVTRPKIVTTFGLSTSRNTAPILKPEPKHSGPQTKSSPPQSQTNSCPPYVSQNTPITSTATSIKPTHKTEHGHTSLSTGFPAPSEEKKQEIEANRKRVEESQGAELPPQPHLPIQFYKPEKKTPILKPTTLSKIPVSGGGRTKQPSRDTQANGDSGHSNPATPVYEEESLIPLSRESSSKDAMSDTSTESEATTPVLSHSTEDILDSAPRPSLGAMSLPRESKIPVKTGSTATYHSLQGKTEVARSKIPVSKVPVRRTSNKPASTFSASAARK